jgi:hypothetical protein
LGFAACKLEFSKFGYLILEFGIYLYFDACILGFKTVGACDLEFRKFGN